MNKFFKQLCDRIVESNCCNDLIEAEKFIIEKITHWQNLNRKLLDEFNEKSVVNLYNDFIFELRNKFIDSIVISMLQAPNIQILFEMWLEDQRFKIVKKITIGFCEDITCISGVLCDETEAVELVKWISTRFKIENKILKLEKKLKKLNLSTGDFE